jgi:ABC-type multidrug transport system fused ATPase/permease subunit
MNNTLTKNNNKSSFAYLTRMLWSLLSKRRKFQFFLLLCLMLIASIADLFSLGAVIPFLGIITFPEKIYQYSEMLPFLNYFKISDPAEILFLTTIFFIAAIFLSGAIRLLLLYSNNRLSFATGGDIAREIYRRNLYQSYSSYIQKNSSEIIDGIFNKADSIIYETILPVCNLLSGLILLIVILGAILIINPVLAFKIFSGFGLAYFIIIIFTKKIFLLNGKKIALKTKILVKLIQESFGSFRDILISGSQSFYYINYQELDLSIRKSQATNLFLGQAPRFLMETIGAILIALFAFNLTSKASGVIQLIPLFGAFVLGAQRVLPLFQQSFNAWAYLQGGKASLVSTIDFMTQTPESKSLGKANNKISFKKSIKLENIDFSYNKNQKLILKDISLVIDKGNRVGFIGKTGSGKSTLLDIIMGLLSPSRGSIKIDNKTLTSRNIRSWQNKLAHVPQSIYLSDASIAENIAFGVPKHSIDMELVKKSADIACVSADIELMRDGYQTFVGERGIRLSGGQRQRLGIARAFYRQADIIIFDEATSALDLKTERNLIQEISKLSPNITLLIISHRMLSLQDCDYIIEINNSSIRKLAR